MRLRLTRNDRQKNAPSSLRLRCPAAAAPGKAGLHLADRGAHCAWASSATGSAQARGLCHPERSAAPSSFLCHPEQAAQRRAEGSVPPRGKRILRLPFPFGKLRVRVAQNDRQKNAPSSLRLRCPATASPRIVGLRLADRGTHYALASSATGSAKARGLCHPERSIEDAESKDP